MKIKDFKELLKIENGYEIVKEFSDETKINSHNDKILIKHKKCNKEYFVTYHDFKNGRRCPYCAGRYKTTKSVSEEITKLTNSEYSLISGYLGTRKELLVKHNSCGNIFKTTYSRFFGKKENNQGNRCPYCSHEHALKSIEEIKKNIKDLVGEEYEVLSTKYLGNKIPIKFLHKKCGNIFEMRYNGFYSNGYRCPICSLKSKGEEKIISYLNSKNIKYKRQYRIKECKDKRPLPFDFYIELDNNKFILLEYNGIQHYLPNGKKPFSTQTLKDHDKIKKDYCKNNHINLVTISYKDYEKIEEILEEIISTTIH